MKGISLLITTACVVLAITHVITWEWALLIILTWDGLIYTLQIEALQKQVIALTTVSQRHSKILSASAALNSVNRRIR